MKNLMKYQTLTAEAEQIEGLMVTGMLRKEGSQSDFKGGWLEMWTVLLPYYDKKGYNRQFSTFSLEGLREIGLITGVK